MDIQTLLFLIGRILFGGFFIFNALNHLVMGREMLTGYAEAKGVPAPGPMVIVTGLLLLIGGLSILLGYQPVIGVAALAIFLIPTSFQMHDFWNVEDQQAQMSEMTNFMKNMALLGAALMFLVISTPWPFGLG